MICVFVLVSGFYSCHVFALQKDVQCPIARLCHELMLESFEEKEITKKCQTKLELEAVSFSSFD